MLYSVYPLRKTIQGPGYGAFSRVVDPGHQEVCNASQRVLSLGLAA
jgi:hypothetical protein